MKKRRVLVIDDDRLIANIFATSLLSAGFDTVIEESPVNALDRLLNREHFDLIISDVRMVEMDGWELLDIIRTQLGLDEINLPVIIVSAYDSSEMRMRSIKHRANAWFTKPIKPIANLVETAMRLTGLYDQEDTDATG